MSKDITIMEDGAALLEKVIVDGDLSRLTPRERVDYYQQVCESLGLNPFTKPFAYINLQGKLTLYAQRTCADQLRSRNNVSVIRLERTVVDDLCIVECEVKDKTGRADAEIGVVSVAGLRGEARANALMKAVTKAKRRATLSICGLGWLDATEVDTIPGAVVVDMAEAHGGGEPIVEPIIRTVEAVVEEPAKDEAFLSYMVAGGPWKEYPKSVKGAQAFSRDAIAEIRRTTTGYAKPWFYAKAGVFKLLAAKSADVVAAACDVIDALIDRLYGDIEGRDKKDRDAIYGPFADDITALKGKLAASQYGAAKETGFKVDALCQLVFSADKDMAIISAAREGELPKAPPKLTEEQRRAMEVLSDL